MKTHFASPERNSNKELQSDILKVSDHSIIHGLLTYVGGLIAVLNKHRQVISLNENYLKTIGVSKPSEVLGLRPGEIFKCIHAKKMPGGCGTSEFCSSCGAAIAIVTSLESERPVSKKCALTIQNGNIERDVFLQVRSCPLRIRDELFLLVFLQDITREQNWAILEKTFYHDINNIMSILYGLMEHMTLSPDTNNPKFVKRMHTTIRQIAQEMALQGKLANFHDVECRTFISSFTADEVIEELRIRFAHHPVSFEKTLSFPEPAPAIKITSDFSIVVKILTAMLVNALESSEKGDEVRVNLVENVNECVFRIWNAQFIDRNISKRIFQRNFSTKPDPGRGLGTYSMKYLGEKILNGKVFFTTSEENGTSFYLSLSLKGRPD